MKKYLLIVTAYLALSTFGYAQNTVQTPNTAVGIDYALPYTLLTGSTTVTHQANANMGLDYRYYFSDNMNLGARLATDIEEQAGTTRQYSLAPGIQYQWFQGHTWMPYLRSDLPYIFHGAANSVGESGKQDLGFTFGSGIAWNLGNQIGINHLVFRYDFTFTYTFGIGDALKVLSFEFFKIGAEYRF